MTNDKQCCGHCHNEEVKEAHTGCCGGHHHTHAHDGCCGGHHHHDHHGCGCGHHHGDDEFEANHGVNIQFSGEFGAPVEAVWDMLTQADKVKQWFPELELTTVETGKPIVFRYADGGTEEMMILDVEPQRYLSFTWDINIVSFDLTPLPNGHTQVVFTEWIAELNDHTPKDLTGWVVCLQQIAAILEGNELADREERFHELYPQVQSMLQQQTDTEIG